MQFDGLPIDILVCVGKASSQQRDTKTIARLTEFSFVPNEAVLGKDVSFKLLLKGETASSTGYDTDEDIALHKVVPYERSQPNLLEKPYVKLRLLRM